MNTMNRRETQTISKRGVDFRLSMIVCYLIFVLSLINSAHLIQSVLTVPADMISNISKAFLAIMLVMNSIFIIKRIRIEQVAFIIAASYVYMISIILENGNRYFYSTTNMFIVNILPMFIVVTTIEEQNLLRNLMTKTSYLVIGMSLLAFIIARRTDNSYAMGFANSITLPVILLINEYTSSKRLADLIPITIGVLVITIIGSRGALLGIAAFVVCLLIKGFMTNNKQIHSILAFLVLILFITFHSEIARQLILFLDKYGIRSRTLTLLSESGIHDSGRSSIYTIMINEILREPLVIHGIASEYLVTGGFYAHNFLLELMYDFGIVIGSVSILVIFSCCIGTILRFIHHEDESLSIAFLCSSLPLMMVSGSIWTTTYFWLWIASMFCRER